jgi:hypothetical protein
MAQRCEQVVNEEVAVVCQDAAAVSSAWRRIRTDLVLCLLLV